MAKLSSENRKYRMQVNAAWTVFKKRDLKNIQRKMETDPKTGIAQEVIVDEDEVQDQEFAVEFYGTSVPEQKLDRALLDLFNVIKGEMRKKGLIRS